MNMNQVVNMITRLVLRRAIKTGIDAGVNLAAKRRGGDPQNPEAAKHQGAQGKQTAKRARQAMRLSRRIGRF